MVEPKPPVLKALFVFNPLYGPREDNEEQKLLYYYPSSENLGVKCKRMGLTEGFVNFTRTFRKGNTASEECCVHTQKHRQAIFSPEENFWMVLIVQNPYIPSSGTKSTESASSSNLAKRGDTPENVKWCEDALDDSHLEKAIRIVYNMFKMVHGPLQQIVNAAGGDPVNKGRDQRGADRLRQILEQFFPIYLPILAKEFNNLSIFPTLDGISFLPVDKNIYLRVHCFINLTENTFPKIESSIVMYRDYLVWSGLNKQDTRILYKYLSTYLPKQLQADSKGEFFPLNKNSQSGFVIGPTNLNQNDYTPPVIHLSEQDKRIIIFQRKEVTCVFLVSNPWESTGYVALHQYIVPQCDSLAPLLSDHVLPKPTVDESLRYIYFNNMNLAVKTTIGQGKNTSWEIMQILSEMNSDFEKSLENISETMVRTFDNRWVVGKRSDSRVLFVTFDDKKTELVDVAATVKKLNYTQFGNIFLD